MRVAFVTGRPLETARRDGGHSRTRTTRRTMGWTCGRTGMRRRRRRCGRTLAGRGRCCGRRRRPIDVPGVIVEDKGRDPGVSLSPGGCGGRRAGGDPVGDRGFGGGEALSGAGRAEGVRAAAAAGDQQGDGGAVAGRADGREGGPGDGRRRDGLADVRGGASDGACRAWWWRCGTRSRRRWWRARTTSCAGLRGVEWLLEELVRAIRG